MKARVVSKRIFLLGLLLMLLAGCGSKSKEELYTSGLAAVKAGNQNGAIVLFKSALDKDRNFKEARYQLAKAYMSAGKNDLAEKEFNTLISQDPSRSEIKLELAKLYLMDRNPGQAVSEITDYVRVHGETPKALELSGIASASENKPDNAENYFLESLKDKPSNSVKLELATLYLQDRMTGKEGDAGRLANEVLSSDPRNTRAYYLLAQLAVLSGKSDEALSIYRKVSEIDKSDAFALYKSGLLYIEQGQFDRALQCSATLLNKFPNGAEGHCLRGIVDYYKKDYADSIPELQRCERIRPTAEACYFLGLSYLDRGELENALSQFGMILGNNPFSERAEFLTALIQMRLKRVDDCITEIKKLIASDPGLALAHNLLGSAYMSKGMYDEGLKELNEAIKLDPKIVDPHLKEGIFYLSEGKLKDAESNFATAVDIAPDILSTRLVLASFYMSHDDYAKAMGLLEQGICGKKTDAALYNNMALVMFAQNRQAEGLKYLQKAEQADPAYLTASFNIATYFAACNQYEKAVQEYRLILQKSPRNAKALLGMAALLELEGKEDAAYDSYRDATETRSKTAYLALAGYLMRRKLDKEALSVLRDAAEAIPQNIEALEMREQILLYEGRFQDAVDACADIASIDPRQGLLYKVNAYLAYRDAADAAAQARRYIVLNPNSAFGYMTMSRIYESENKLDWAIQEVKAGINAESGNLQALLMLGDIYMKKKDYRSAGAAYAQALQKNQDFTPALFSQGAMLDEMGRKKEAVAIYREALMKSANYLPALNNLAYLYVNGYGSPQEGLRLAFLCYRLAPADPAVMDTLGYALLKNNRGSEALRLLEKSAALLPDSPTVTYHLALAFKENRMRARAVTALRRSLSLGGFPEEADARELLKQLD